MNSTVADLKIGDMGIINRVEAHTATMKLMEMGCVPGNEVTMKFVAPLGDPIAIEILGYTLSMRRAEASHIVLES